MANLRDIKKRIGSVQSTKQITRTMEMVATAKIRHATDRIMQATPYSLAMLEALDGVIRNIGSIDNPFFAPHPHQKTAIAIVISSDRGLAGGFNSNVFREVEKYRALNAQKGVETQLVCCGKKAIAYFTYRKLEALMEFRDLSADPTIAEAREISSHVRAAYDAMSCDEVMIFYNHARNSADQDLRQTELLPINPAAALDAYWGKAEKEEPQGPRPTSEFEPDVATVLESLIPAYVDCMIYAALLDSAAAEQGARRKAMKSATDNAEDMLFMLNRLYNRVRQGAITTEITEIVGGAAALEKD